MNLRITLTILLTTIAAALTETNAQLTASQAFTSAPHHIFPMLDVNTRLDMLDYFNSGMSTPSTNSLSGKSRITAISPLSLTINMTEASTYQLAVLPAGTDSLLAVITTVATPAPDSKMTVYSNYWGSNVTAKVFAKPTLKDWLTEQGHKNFDDVEMLVPFLLISYDYNPDLQTLTLTNNTKQLLSADVYEMVEPYLQPQLTYRFTGKKFTLVK